MGQPIKGEKLQKEFIVLYGSILRARNILTTFDEFSDSQILAERDFQDYQSEYLDLYQNYKPKTNEQKEIINDDIVFEIELVKQVEINIDYILLLVKKYQKNEDKEILLSIDKAINSSLDLRSKVKLIHDFIQTVNAESEVDEDWKKYVNKQIKVDLDKIISDEKLKPEATYHFIANSFRDEALKTTGTDIDAILPPVSRFGGGNRDKKKQTVIQKLKEYFDLYIDLFFGDDVLKK